MLSQFIRFTTEDRLILQGIVYRPELKTQKAYLHIHGMSGNFYENRFLDAMASRLTEAGYAFASVNTRGHDVISDFPLAGETESYKRIGDAFETFEECILDIRAALDLLEAQGYTDITLCGHSLGAVKVAYYQATTQDARVHRLVLMSPPDMVTLAERDVAYQELVTSARQLVQDGKGEEILLKKLWGSYFLCARTFLDLTAHDTAVDVFNLYDRAKPSVLGSILIPVFVLFGEKDDVLILSQEETVEVLQQKLHAVASFSSKILEGASHGYFGREELVAKAIVDWLSA